MGILKLFNMNHPLWPIILLWNIINNYKLNEFVHTLSYFSPKIDFFLSTFFLVRINHFT